MRTLNGWPLILLAPLFGVALLPTAVMTGLELAGIHWWGPRSNVGLGFIGYFLLELALPKGVSNAATNFGYVFKSTLRRERMEILGFIGTYLGVVHFLPSLLFFCAIDVLFPWNNSIVSWDGVTTVVASTVMFPLLFVMMPAWDFRSGYVQAREDTQKGVPPQINITSLRAMRDARRDQ
jgi:Na+-transporting NADH:ubiquinone oxidoreductase subunit NqrB